MTSRPSNRLKGPQMYQVTKAVEAEYVESGLSDVDFAKKLGERLGYKISRATIAFCRNNIGIDANFIRSVKRPSADTSELQGAVLALTVRVTQLEEDFGRLLVKLGERPTKGLQ